MRIRPFRQADAAALARWMDQIGLAEEVYTPARLVHQRRMLPARGRPSWLVAVVDNEPVALGRDEPQIFGSRPGQRLIWVGVQPDQRRKGIGSEVWRAIEAHARQVGAGKLRSWTIDDDDAGGKQFLLARGFGLVEKEVQWWMDPSAIRAADVERATRTAHEQGFRVVSLRQVLGQIEPALRRLFLEADRSAPGHVESAVAPRTFRRVILDNPLLDLDCSTVVLRDHEPVALSWLKGDRKVGRYGVEFTGTAAAWRDRGLASLAKLWALRLAAQAGIRWVGTSNAYENAPMLAINRRLGHRALPDLLLYERTL